MNSALSHADRLKTSFSSLYLLGLHAHLPLSFPSGAEVVLNMFCYTHFRIKEVNKTMTNKKRKRKKDRYRSVRDSIFAAGHPSSS